MRDQRIKINSEVKDYRFKVPRQVKDAETSSNNPSRSGKNKLGQTSVRQKTTMTSDEHQHVDVNSAIKQHNKTKYYGNYATKIQKFLYHTLKMEAGRIENYNETQNGRNMEMPFIKVRNISTNGATMPLILT